MGRRSTWVRNQRGGGGRDWGWREGTRGGHAGHACGVGLGSGGLHGGGGAHGVGETVPRTVLTAWTPPPPRGPARVRGVGGGCVTKNEAPPPPSPRSTVAAVGGSRGLWWGPSWEPLFPLVSDPSGAPLTYLQLAPGWQPCILVSAFDHGGSFPEWGWGLPGGPWIRPC